MLQGFDLNFAHTFAGLAFSQVIFMLGQKHHQDQSMKGCASSTNRISKYSQGHFATVQFLRVI